jgi:hypothetical protein
MKSKAKKQAVGYYIVKQANKRMGGCSQSKLLDGLDRRVDGRILANVVCEMGKPV